MAGKAEYKNKWQKENCDRVNLTMPKGRKAEIQAHAEAQGESVNGFINRAIDHEMERDRTEGPQEARRGTSASGGGSLAQGGPSSAATAAKEEAGE